MSSSPANVVLAGALNELREIKRLVYHRLVLLQLGAETVATLLEECRPDNDADYPKQLQAWRQAEAWLETVRKDAGA